MNFFCFQTMADAITRGSAFKVLAVLLFLLNTERTSAFQNIENRFINTTIRASSTSFTSSLFQETNEGDYVSSVQTKNNFSEIIFITYSLRVNNDNVIKENEKQFVVKEGKSLYVDAIRSFESPKIYFVIKIKPFVHFNEIDKSRVNFLRTVNTVMPNGINSNGVSMNIDHCLSAIITSKGLEDIWHFLHFILFNVEIKGEILRCGTKTAVGCIEGKMKKCERMLSKLPVKKIFYEISGDYDNSTHLHTEIFSERQWKMAKNVEILIRELGDKITSRKNDTKNWIKLGEKIRTGLSYHQHTTQQLYWTEKDSSSEAGSDKNPLNSTCPQSPISLQNPASEIFAKESQIIVTNAYFNGKHFGVGFNPRLMEFSGYSEFDAYDLYPFIELISTKFRNIFTFFPRLVHPHPDLIHTKYYLSHLENLLVAVATFNRDKSLAKNRNETSQIPTLEIFVEVELERSLYRLIDEVKTTVATVQKFVGSANSIFKGTIPYILLKGTDTIEEYNNDFVLLQIISIKQRANNQVGIGATFELRDCRNLVPVLQILPFAVFRKLPTENDVERGATAFLHILNNELKECVQAVRYRAPNCRVGLQTSWSDTDINGGKNITALTWLWTSLLDVAVKENVTVFFESAFDEPNNKNSQHTGWWELKDPRPCYGSTKEIQFLEKRLNPEKYIGAPSSNADEVTNIIKLGNKRIHLKFVKELQTNLSGKRSLFNREQFGAKFSFSGLFGDYGSSDYSKKDVKKLVGLVHTRFSRVLIDLVSENSRISEQPHVNIPEQAAWLNKENEKNLNRKTEKFIQIFIPVEIYGLQNNIQNVLESIHVAKYLAVKANNIFSQTVPYLLMDLTRLSLVEKRTEFVITVKKTISFLKPEKQLLQKKNETQSYQLGVVFERHFCVFEKRLTTEYVTLEDISTYIFPLAYIAFIRVDIRGGMDLFKNETMKFENCAEKIKSRFPNLTAGVIFNLLHFKLNSTDVLVDFWRQVNAYSKTNNTPVFMEWPIDNQRYKNGWWKIRSEDGEEYIEEKYESKETPAERHDDNNLTLIMGSVFAGCVGIVVISYAIYKIYEIKHRRDAYTALSGLTEVEIIQFFAGRNQDDAADAETEFRNEQIDRFQMTHYFSDCAYDQSLELETNAFTLDVSLHLGSGAYGQVCMGRVLLAGSEVRVAVKRVSLVGVGEEGLTGLRSLLSEIKVLSYLGRNDHIVALLGAHTGKISKGEVFVFLELCSRGSLHKCLSILRNAEKDSTNDPYTYLDECSGSHDKNQLANWSSEIAKGMQFLAGKHVVHADLATRNVLLDVNNKAKICDFGLSRRMMNYQSYVKSHQEPLPWRWMSPESLRLFLFNEKTDIWSFGVTMWEIFTLGNLPFAGLSWTVDFATSLEEDLRLPIPRRKSGPLFEDKNMYAIMQRCWETDPKERPTFQQLVLILSEE